MTEKELSFCKQHDWGRAAFLAGGRIYNLDDVSVGPGGIVAKRKVSFGNFKDLKAWAGY